MAGKKETYNVEPRMTTRYERKTTIKTNVCAASVYIWYVLFETRESSLILSIHHENMWMGVMSAKTNNA